LATSTKDVNSISTGSPPRFSLITIIDFSKTKGFSTSPKNSRVSTVSTPKRKVDAMIYGDTTDEIDGRRE
jgi:hypothetical protein